jgi:hypothetical protein
VPDWLTGRPSGVLEGRGGVTSFLIPFELATNTPLRMLCHILEEELRRVPCGNMVGLRTHIRPQSTNELVLDSLEAVRHLHAPKQEHVLSSL